MTSEHSGKELFIKLIAAPGDKQITVDQMKVPCEMATSDLDEIISGQLGTDQTYNYAMNGRPLLDTLLESVLQFGHAFENVLEILYFVAPPGPVEENTEDFTDWVTALTSNAVGCYDGVVSWSTFGDPLIADLDLGAVNRLVPLGDEALVAICENCVSCLIPKATDMDSAMRDDSVEVLPAHTGDDEDDDEDAQEGLGVTWFEDLPRGASPTDGDLVGRILATGDAQGAVHLISASAGASVLLDSFQVVPHAVKKLVRADDAHFWVSGTLPKLSKVALDGMEVILSAESEHQFTSIAVRDAHTVVSGHSHGAPRVWDSREGIRSVWRGKVSALPAETGMAHAILANDNSIIVGTGSGRLVQWDMRLRESVSIAKASDDDEAILAMSWTDSRRLFRVGGADSQVRSFSLA